MRLQWCSSFSNVKNILILLTLKYVNSKMDGFIVGGAVTNILTYPHSVYLDINGAHPCLCGGSILNHELVLSAAHCFDKYNGRKKDSVIIRYGGTSLSSMSQTSMLYYRLHAEYNEHTLKCDISLIRCKTPIKLGKSVKRIAIMQFPPNEPVAYVAGWGSINNEHDLAENLKATKQVIRIISLCKNHLSIPDGTFCAGPLAGPGHPNVGDSGGALVVNNYIQIGIVSFKEHHSSLVVYTNVSYYYSWIRTNAAITYCAGRRGR